MKNFLYSPVGMFKSSEVNCTPSTNITPPWDAYQTQFEMLAKMDGWSDQEKATILAINLKTSKRF